MEKPDLNFKEIYQNFYAPILRYLTRVAGSHEAEDLTQEVFLKINQSLDSYRGDAKLSTWVYRIATNTAIDRMRRNQSGDRVNKELANETAMQSQVIDLNRQVIRNEMNDCIRLVVNDLPEQYRMVLILKEFEGFKNSEIANILAVSLDTVKIRLHRARARLKREMDCRCTLYLDERNELACERK